MPLPHSIQVLDILIEAIMVSLLIWDLRLLFAFSQNTTPINGIVFWFKKLDNGRNMGSFLTIKNRIPNDH